MSCAPALAEVARSGIQNAFLHDSSPRGRSRRQIHHWSLELEQAALFWCSNGPGMLPDERHMEKIGSSWWVSLSPHLQS